jgi:hypothetical protein
MSRDERYDYGLSKQQNDFPLSKTLPQTCTSALKRNFNSAWTWRCEGGLQEGVEQLYRYQCTTHVRHGSPSLKDSRPDEGELPFGALQNTQALTNHRSNAASSAPFSTQPANALVTRSCASACVVLRSLHTTLVASLHSRTCKSYTLASRPTTNSRKIDWSTCRLQRAEERARQRRRGQQQVRLDGRHRCREVRGSRY